MSEIGHNSGAQRVAQEELAALIERIERLQDEKKVAAAEYRDQINAVWAEAKARGYDKKAMQQAMRLRALSDEDRAVVNLYLDNLGVFG